MACLPVESVLRGSDIDLQGIHCVWMSFRENADSCCRDHFPSHPRRAPLKMMQHDIKSPTRLAALVCLIFLCSATLLVILILE